MFGTQTRFVVVGAAVLFCAVATIATVDVITADFVETRTSLPNSTLRGKLYYYYDSANDGVNSRLRMEYTLPGGATVNNLNHYGDGALYSMCSKCTGTRTTEKAKPWYYNKNEGVYDKSNEKDDATGYYWYTLKVASSASQVQRILMDGSGAGQSKISKIEMCDGRTLVLSNVKHESTNTYPATHAKFNVDQSLDCPKATCPVFADIVFVLDNSMSLDGTEWQQQIKFVEGVMDEFTFDYYSGVEAAVIQFNGNFNFKKECNRNCFESGDKCWKQKQCLPTCVHKGDYATECPCKDDYDYGNVAYPGSKTATVFAGKDDGTGVKGLSASVRELKNDMKTRPNNGMTCQGYGLELAMHVLDRSPRKDFAKKPYNIVIAVTDGGDQCPNKTIDAANKLRKEYGAFVIEIGVGMQENCHGYYKDFLRNLASKIGGTTTPAYYDVQDYAAIKTVAEQLFKPLCADFGNQTECGSDCYGFCGCGKCFCPDCVKSDSSCYDIGCKADANNRTATGCNLTTIPCPIESDICTTYVCDGTKTGDARCTGYANPCTEKYQEAPGTCREVYCNPSKGGCYVHLNNVTCQTAHGNGCLEYECTPVGETPDIALTGCRLVTNKTKLKEDELISNNKSGCFVATCDPTNGEVGEKDICDTPYPKCYTSTCQQNATGGYSCVVEDYKRPDNTECVTYKCEVEGWVVDTEITDDDCLEAKGGNETNKCNHVYCDPDFPGGCRVDEIPECEDNCTIEKMAECVKDGVENYSSVDHCVLGMCYVKEVTEGDETIYNLDCNFTMSYENCTETKAEEVEKLNDLYPEKCYTPACGDNGRCKYVEVPVPEGMPWTKCMAPVCEKKSDGSWNWVYKPTTVNLTCKSDACTFRECRNDANETLFPDGCHKEDICMNQTTECATYKCNIEGAEPVCERINATFIETDCTKEVCQDGKKVLVNLDPRIVCPGIFKERNISFDKCHEAVCLNGMCDMVETKPLGPINECTNYTCNPETGIFDETPKCDDGIYCTSDTCSVQGECKYEAIICDNLISMEAYPCFQARCKEDLEKKDFSCVRKLISDAYIDVCGNCIMEAFDVQSGSSFPETTSNSGSTSESRTKSVDLTQCTGAPAKPLITEGLAAASIALIILFAIIIGAAIAASSVLGTKTLIERAKGADNQSAHSNPLFEENETELSNPTYAGDADI